MRAGPPDVPTMHPRITLDPANFRGAAEEMVAAVLREHEEGLESARAKLPREIPVASDFGLHSQLHVALTKVGILPLENLEQHLEKELLPLMVKELGYKYVVPVSVNAPAQQSYSSFAKNVLVAQRFGPSQLERRVLKSRALHGIELSGFDILGIVDGLTRLAPVAFTMPVDRPGSAWHFYADGFRSWPLVANRGLFGEFMSQVSPRSEEVVRVLTGAGSMDEANIWRLLREAVYGANRLVRCLNDPRTSAGSTGAIDFLAQLQAYGAVRLIIADLLAMNHSTVDHDRIVFAFAFMDKLANLRSHVGGMGGAEARLFEGLASISQGKELKRLMRQTMGLTHPELATALVPVIGVAYGGLHRHLGSELPGHGKSETKRLGRLRAFRNMNHGTYLRKRAFDALFLGAVGTVPHELVTLPFVLMLGLLSDPDVFLKFQPVVRS